MKAKKAAVLLFALVLVLSSCSGGGMAESSLQRELTTLNISVQTGADADMVEGIRTFAQKLNTISEGAFNINLFYEDDPLASLMQKEIDIIVVSDKYMAQYDPRFELIGTPFFFKKPLYASMALNSESYKKLTAEFYNAEFGIRQLTAVVNNSKVFLSTKGRIKGPENVAGLKIALQKDGQYSSMVFEKMKATVLKTSTGSAAELLLNGRADLYEINYSDIINLAPEDAKDYYLLESFHEIDTLWMFVSSEKYQTLTEEEKALLTEGVAYFTAEMEETRFTQLKQHIAVLEENGLIISSDFTAIRSMAKTILDNDPNFASQFEWEYYTEIYNIIR